jgi:hypothetical protein
MAKTRPLYTPEFRRQRAEGGLTTAEREDSTGSSGRTASFGSTERSCGAGDKAFDVRIA